MDRRKFLQKISVVAAVPAGLLEGEVARAESVRKTGAFGGGPRAHGALPKDLKGEALSKALWAPGQRWGPFLP